MLDVPSDLNQIFIFHVCMRMQMMTYSYSPWAISSESFGCLDVPTTCGDGNFTVNTTKNHHDLPPTQLGFFSRSSFSETCLSSFPLASPTSRLLIFSTVTLVHGWSIMDPPNLETYKSSWVFIQNGPIRPWIADTWIFTMFATKKILSLSIWMTFQQKSGCSQLNFPKPLLLYLNPNPSSHPWSAGSLCWTAHMAEL